MPKPTALSNNSSSRGFNRAAAPPQTPALNLRTVLGRVGHRDRSFTLFFQAVRERIDNLSSVYVHCGGTRGPRFVAPLAAPREGAAGLCSLKKGRLPTRYDSQGGLRSTQTSKISGHLRDPRAPSSLFLSFETARQSSPGAPENSTSGLVVRPQNLKNLGLQLVTFNQPIFAPKNVPRRPHEDRVGNRSGPIWV